MAHKKTKEELEDELSEQIEFLRASAALYDQGQVREAKRLANHCYILLHDGKGNTYPLLRRLGLRESMTFVSTECAKHNRYIQGSKRAGPAKLAPCTYTNRSESRRIICSALDKSHVIHIEFHAWWNESVYNPLPDFKLSRREIIFFMRSQHGGSHVDDNIRSDGYHSLITRGLPEVQFSFNEKGVCFYSSRGRFYVLREAPPENSAPPGTPDDPRLPVKNGHFATVRQIAWDVDQSLKGIGY